MAKKKKPRLRRITDKSGRTYWIDSQGRRAKPGAKPKPPQPKDQYGRFLTADARRKVARVTKKGKKIRVPTLPPTRGPSGRFVEHPIRKLLRALHERKISRDEFTKIAFMPREPEKRWPRPTIEKILDRAGFPVNRATSEPPFTREGFTERSPGEDDDDDEPDRYTDRESGESDDGISEEDWSDMLDDLDLSNDEIWAIYDEMF